MAVRLNPTILTFFAFSLRISLWNLTLKEIFILASTNSVLTAFLLSEVVELFHRQKVVTLLLLDPRIILMKSTTLGRALQILVLSGYLAAGTSVGNDESSALLPDSKQDQMALSELFID